MPNTEGVADLRGPAAEGSPKATVTLACRHQLTRYLADHPQALRGFLIRCPTCNALRTVWLVKSVPTASGSAGSEHTGMGAGHRLLIVAGDDPFRPGGGGAGGRPSDDGFPPSAWEQV